MTPVQTCLSVKVQQEKFMKNKRYLDENGNFQPFRKELFEAGVKAPEKKATETSPKIAAKPSITNEVKGLSREELEILLIVELRAIAKDNKLNANKKMNKSQLVDLIVGEK